MATPQKYSIRDYQMDYLRKRVSITTRDLEWALSSLATSPTIASPATPTLQFSVGSPTLSQIGSTSMGAVALEATTDEIDIFWPVPPDIDNRQPVYFRHKGTSGAIGATPTAQFRTAADAIATSGTFVRASTIQTTLTWSKTSTAQFGLIATARGKIGVNVSGASTGMVFPEDTEYVKFNIAAASSNHTLSTNPILWTGMDLEYTPRLTFGDGSRREARKMETTLGDSEIGAANGY